MADVRSKALGYLRAGRVRVESRSGVSGEQVRASVLSSREESTAWYVVDRWPNGDWTCTCKAGGDGTCPHAAAVALVTMPHESAARAS